MKSLRSALFAALLITAVPAFAAQPTVEITARPFQTGSVPLGAQRIEFLALTLEASCDADQAIESMTFRHLGLGTPADIDGLSLWSGTRRITRSIRPQQKDGIVTFRLRGVIVPKCGTLDLTLRGDLSPDAAAGGEHAFVLRGPTDVVPSSPDTSIVVSGSLTMPTTLRTTPTLNTTIVPTMLQVTTPVTYGSRRTVARMQLRSAGSRAQQVTRITLTNDGSAADTDLQNLRLLNSKGVQISDTVPSMQADSVSFTLTEPLVFDGSDTYLLSVRADVRASRRRTIDFEVEEPSDIEAQLCTGARMCNQAH